MMKRIGNFASQKFRLKQMQMSILFDDLKQLKKRIMKEYEKKKYDYAMEFLEKGGYLPHFCEHNPNLKRVDEEIYKAECEICLDTLTAKPIYSCKCCYNLICERCAVNVHACPFCRIRRIDFAERNRAVERFVSTLTLPCKYQRYGCTALLNRNSREPHEKYCIYAPIFCPYFRVCGFSGELEGLHKHLMEGHNTTLVLDDDFDVHIQSLKSKLKSTFDKKKSNSVMLYCYNLLFICKITLFKNVIHFSFKQAKSSDEEVVVKKYAAFLEITSPDKCIKGMIPISSGKKTEEFEVSPDLLFSEETDKDGIHIYLSIKCLDEMLK